MTTKKLFGIITIFAAVAVAAAQGGSSFCDEPLPIMPVYADSTQWHVTDRNAKVDVFYIISTEIGDYCIDGVTRHYSDTLYDSIRRLLLGEMVGVDRLVSGDLNFYSPYYRQCSLQLFTSDSLMRHRLIVPTCDVRRAFGYYLDYLNNDRPFIIAGFSQGAMIALQLLKEMDIDTRRRMVAAYIIGATITKEDIEHCPNIKPAQGADDTGVTICYNSVRDTHCVIPLLQSSAVAINPVNWKTDDTPAILITAPSPHEPVSDPTVDTLTVHLDVASGLLLVDGFTATDYVLPLIGREGCYHSREIWLYRDCLRQNMATRAAAFLQTNGRLMPTTN